MTAGARSISMLPKISDSIGFNKIQKKYAIQSEKPRFLRDHWNVIKDIVKHPAFENTWDTELLLFSEKWFQNLHDPTWRDFKNLCLEAAWKSSAFWRNQYTWDLTFSRIQSDRYLKPCPYIADVVSHLLAMTAGAMPGFCPAIDDTMAPISKLQKVFEDDTNPMFK